MGTMGLGRWGVGTRMGTLATASLAIARTVACLCLAFASAAAGTSGQASADRTTRVPAEAPLRTEAGRLIVTADGPGGAALDFILSTGNATTVLTESAAARLAGSTDVRLGGVVVDMSDPHVVPDAELTLDGHAVTGMIGANTLSRYDLLIDAPGGRLVLAEIGPRVEWPGVALSRPVRMRVYHGVVLGIDVTVNGVEYMAALDLGVPSLMVNEALRTAAGLEREDSVTLGLGDATFPNQATSLSDHPMFERWDPNGSGFLYVGASIATDCAIALSWVRGELRTCVR